MSTILFEAIEKTLLHFLWQGCVIGALYGIFLGAFRTTPEIRHRVGCLTLLVLIGFATKTFHSQYSFLQASATSQPKPVPFVQQHTELTFSGCMSCHTIVANPSFEALSPNFVALVHQDEDETGETRTFWTTGLWASGMLLLTLRLIISHSLTLRLRRRHCETPSTSIESRLTKISNELGVKRSVQFFISDTLAIPIVIGWLRPTILLPRTSIAELSRTQLDSVLAHELAHIKRHDYFINLFQHLVGVFFFFHPAVWFVSRAIRKEREFCCDDMAVKASQSTIEYARALTTLEELRAHRPSLGMAASGGSLITRIKRLAGHDSARSYPLLLGSTCILVIALTLPMTVLSAPAMSQKNEPVTRKVEILPLPSHEAERGIRHLLGKARGSHITYQSFAELTVHLDSARLIALIAEVREMKNKDYADCALKALLAERDRRNLSGAISPAVFNHTAFLSTCLESNSPTIPKSINP